MSESLFTSTPITAMMPSGSYMPANGSSVSTMHGANTGTFFSSSTPELMISMDKILNSTIAGYEGFAQLYEWGSEAARLTTGDMGNSLFTSATIHHSLIEVEIPNAGYSNILETIMYNGKKITKVTVVRLGHIESKLVKIQEVIYGNCRLQRFKTNRDRIIMAFSIETKQSTTFVYAQDGQSTGQTALTVDFTKNTVSS